MSVKAGIFHRLSALYEQWRFRVVAARAGLVLRLTGRELVKTGRCIGCGCCCEKINLRIGTRWLRAESEYDALIKDRPEYARFAIVGRDPEGLLQFRCTWLDEHGRCSKYADRLDICKSFPNKSLLLCGGQLPASCGFVVSAAVPFRKRLDQAIRSHDKHQDSSA